jgi:transcription elongation GreA/GreB family factor
LGEKVDLIEMMYKTNIIVLVLASQRNKVVIWDDHEKKNRTEITFNNNVEIKNIKLRKEMLLVVLDDKVFVFNFETLKLIE